MVVIDQVFWSIIECCHSLIVDKQVHKEFIGGLDVIMTSDFYQAPPIQDLWIFKLKTDEFNILGTHFWHENINVVN